MTLTLYRRHTKTCSKGYVKYQRVYRPNGIRQRKADCECPISVEGKLKYEVLINRSTKETSWSEAEAVVSQWEIWGRTTPPQEEQIVPTVEYAIKSFLASQGPSGRNVEPSTYSGFQVLLRQRLEPWAKHKPMSLFDDLDTVSKFVESWSNLVTREPLADSTRKTELERFRAFLAYSLDRNWVRFNHAKKIKFSFKTEPKYGMSSDEEYRLFADIHSDELRAFCLVMRWAGLRISDATTLNDSQLIERASGNGWAIRIEQTKKTREPVYVPIPSFVEAALRQLPHKYEAHGRRYWFWSGECELETAKNNWYTKIMRVVNRNKFLHAVTPHTFRHTFAISHLNAGVDVKLVSRWLSHASVVVTEKHYAQAIHGTLVASDEAFDASIKKQRQVMTA